MNITRTPTPQKLGPQFIEVIFLVNPSAIELKLYPHEDECFHIFWPKDVTQPSVWIIDDQLWYMVSCGNLDTFFSGVQDWS